MTGRTYLPTRAAVAILAVLGSACAGGRSPAPTPRPAEAERARLLACPSGDRAWREALARAGGSEAALGRLEALARDAAERCPARWEPRWTAGETLFRRARAGEARAAYEVALAFARDAGSDTGIACAANRLGSLAYFRNELDLADALFGEALEAARRAGRRDLEAYVLNNLAGLLKERGDLAGAAAVFERAAALLARLELPKPARDAAYNEGTLLLSLGDAATAERRLRAVAREAEAQGDGEIRNLVRIALGSLFLVRSEPAAAAREFDAVARDRPQFAVSAEMGLGRAALAERRYGEAERRLATAARRARASDLAIDALLADTYRGQALLESGREAEAAALLRRVGAEADRSGSREYAGWLARWLLGRAEERLGRRDAAIARYRESIAILESSWHALDPLGPGLHFLAERADPYRSLALALARKGAPAGIVLEAIEHAHARALARAAAVAGRAGPAVDASRLAEDLGPGERLVDFLIARDAGVAVSIGGGGARTYLTPGWDALEAPLARYRRALTRPLSSLPARAHPREDLALDLEAGEALSRALLGPLARDLPSLHRLTVVPDGPLALLPFAALPLPREPGAGMGALRFLGERIETAVMPAAGRAPRWDGPRAPLLLAGDPLPGDGRSPPPLPRAGAELDALARLWAPSPLKVVRGRGFTPETLLGLDGSRYGTIHLATHARASTLDPRRCAIRCSSGTSLGFDRIARLRLPPGLVVLSACDTGRGELVPGEGIVGLTWAFLRAGARGVVASLWSVDDAAASELMVRFHARLRAGDDPVGALAAARREERRQRWHPAYWAPFVIVESPLRR